MADEEQNRSTLARAQNQRSVAGQTREAVQYGRMGAQVAGAPGAIAGVGLSVIRRRPWLIVVWGLVAALPLLLPLLGIALVFGIFLTLVGIL